MDEEVKGYINRMLQTINRVLDMQTISQKTIIILSEKVIKLESKVKKLEEQCQKKDNLKKKKA